MRVITILLVAGTQVTELYQQMLLKWQSVKWDDKPTLNVLNKPNQTKLVSTVNLRRVHETLQQ